VHGKKAAAPAGAVVESLFRQPLAVPLLQYIVWEVQPAPLPDVALSHCCCTAPSLLSRHTSHTHSQSLALLDDKQQQLKPLANAHYQPCWLPPPM
jgi:hypothetical protein